MKKLMIGILILIPVIILLVIGLVSTIVSMKAYIAVESISLTRRDGDTGTYDDMKIGQFDMNDFFFVSVIPRHSTNSNYMWTIFDVQTLDKDYEASPNKMEIINDEGKREIIDAPVVTLIDDMGRPCESNSSGKILISTYCQFYIRVTAETKTSDWLIYVGGSDVTAVAVSGQNTLKIGESVQLTAELKPISAIVTEYEWIAVDADMKPDDSIVKVNKNGVVTAVSEGTGYVIVKAKKFTDNEMVESMKFPITVQKGVSDYGNSVFVDNKTVSAADIGLNIDAVTSCTNCSVQNGNIIIRDESKPATLTLGEETLTITVVDTDAIVISNRSVFDSSSGYIHSVGEEKLYLTVDWLVSTRSGAPENIIWTAETPGGGSASSIVTIDSNGAVSCIGSGEVVITASYGNYSDSFTLKIRNKVSSVTLEMSDKKFEVGIAEEFIFGSQKFVKEEYALGVASDLSLVANRIPIRITIPYSPDYRDFDYFIDGEPTSDLASIIWDERDEIYYLEFKPENITERTNIKITVKAKYPKYGDNNLTEQSVTVTVVPGVMVFSYAGLYKFGELTDSLYDAHGTDLTYKFPCLVIGNEINFQEDHVLDGLTGDARKNKIKTSISLRSSMYGNNFVIKGGGIQPFENNSTNVFDITGSDILISNVHIRANEVDGTGEITEAQSASGMTAQVLNFYSVGSGKAHATNVRLEYSIIENCSSTVGVYNVDLTIDACILRNTSGAGIFSPQEINGSTEEGIIGRNEYSTKIETSSLTDEMLFVQFSHLNVHNTVMSNMIGSAFSMYFAHFSNDPNKNQRPNWSNIEREIKEKDWHGVIDQTGFWDVYNWQKTKDFKIEGTGQDELVNSILGGFLSTFVQNDARAFPYRVLDKKNSTPSMPEYYMHIGGISIGIQGMVGEPSYAEFSFEDDRFGVMNAQYFLNMDIITLDDYPIFLVLYKNTANIQPDSTYVEGEALYERMRGEG